MRPAYRRELPLAGGLDLMAPARHTVTGAQSASWR
jgi:hypothetical protein